MIDDIRGHLPVRHAEWWASFMTLAVGIWLSRPTQSFTTPTYAIMEQVAPESTWAAFLLELSAARLLALTLNGTFRRTRRWSPLIRSAAACISAMAWALIAFMTGTADTSTLITPIAAMIALGEFGLCLFVARRAGAADRDFQ